jgi:hypothetical protein
VTVVTVCKGLKAAGGMAKMMLVGKVQKGWWGTKMAKLVLPSLKMGAGSAVVADGVAKKGKTKGMMPKMMRAGGKSC